MVPTHGDMVAVPRTSYRFPMVGNQFAQLVVRKRKIPAEIIDVSALGFGIAVDGVLNCSVGQVVVLHTDAASAEAQIMNMSVDHSSPAGVRTHLGLQRLREIPTERFCVNALRSLLQSMKRPLTPLYNSYGAVVPVLVTAGGVATLVWALQYPHAFVPVMTRQIPVASRPSTAGSMSSRLIQTRAARSRSAQPAVPSQGPTRSTTERLSNEVIKRTRPAMLLQRDIVQELALTKHQVAQLQLIAKPQTLDSATSGRRRQAGEHALAILTPEQLEVWKRIVLHR